MYHLLKSHYETQFIYFIVTSSAAAACVHRALGAHCLQSLCFVVLYFFFVLCARVRIASEMMTMIMMAMVMITSTKKGKRGNCQPKIARWGLRGRSVLNFTISFQLSAIYRFFFSVHIEIFVLTRIIISGYSRE